MKSIILVFTGIGVVGCAGEEAATSTAAKSPAAEIQSKPPTKSQPVTRVEAGPDAQKRAQTALIKARSGEVVELGEGRFEFTSTLSLDVSGVTIRGQGPDKTILSFKNQGQGTGGEGILITSKENVEIRDLAVEDAKGDAIKARGTKRIFFRKLRTEWTGGPKETNGGYGIYPVLCSDILIEDCVARGASDSGIYVGQSENIIVRRNRAEQNVAGIEIENSVKADVYENDATNNTGGILVFSLPDLERKDSHHCRVFKNRVVANNHANFAPKGNIVGTVSPGTGMMIMASDGVEVFDNMVEKNNTSGLIIISYLITGRPIKDAKYDPFCEGISVHGNRFASNGTKPGGPTGALLEPLLGKQFPDILFDGIVDVKKIDPTKGGLAGALLLENNTGASFVNFDGGSLDPKAIQAGKLPKVEKDVALYQGKKSPLAAVTIEGLE